MSSSQERLGIAVDRGDVEAVRAALGEGADPNGPGLWCMGLLECAVAAGRVEVMRVLLEAGADPNARTGITCTSLLVEAARSGRVEAVGTLVKFGADPDLLDDALRDVILSEELASIAEAMIELGARIDTPDQNGWTALHRVAAHGDTALVGRLLRAGADASLTTAHGLTPGDIAANNGRLEMAQLLRDAERCE